ARLSSQLQEPMIMKLQTLGPRIKVFAVILLTLYLATPRPDFAQSARGSTVITPGNAGQVVELARFGNGRIRRDVAWSPDGKTIALAGSIGVWLYDATDFSQPGRLLEVHTGFVLGVAFSPDGKTLASGSEDGKVRLWDIGTGKSL